MRAKKYPNQNLDAIQKELIDEVCSYYEGPIDYRGIIRKRQKQPSIRAIADIFGISPQKVKKILITGGKYRTERSQSINKKWTDGKTVEEIAKEEGLTVASVYAYLPYSKIIYNMPEKTANAERVGKWRKKHNY